MKTISLCTVSMNRLFHIRETLLASILENKDSKNLEFVLLDYNSSDGLENWIKSQMKSYIESGRLKYFRTVEPAYFDVCHAKNMALRLATGDIIGMVDADNYAGKNYAFWVNQVFEETGDAAIVTTMHKNYIPYRDTGGKLAFNRNLFYKVRGFDESWTGYGFDDVDLVNRLEIYGGKRVFIENSDHLSCIEHSHLERICNFYLMNNLEEIYSYNCSSGDYSLQVLYLFSNGKYIQANYISDESNSQNQFVTYKGLKLKNGDWTEGIFERNHETLTLYVEDKRVLYNQSEANVLSSQQPQQIYTFNPVSLDKYTDYVMMYSDCRNRLILDKNSAGYAFVNRTGWGLGTVYKNFDYNKPISLYNDDSVPF